MKLSNRTIVVTGGTSGIGLAFALELLNRGSKVIVIGRNQATLDQVTNKHKGLIGLQGDVSNANSVREMAAFIRDRYPEVSILFNSAGIMRAFELMDENLDLERTTAEVETNLTGTIWMTEALLPQLAQQNEAMIVTVSSGLSYVTSPVHPVYSATKAGVHMFTDALRVQLKKSKKNIHVMELVPPLVAETNLAPDKQSGGGIPNMTLDTLVKHGIRGIEQNKKRVVPGFSKFLRFAGKYFPDVLSNAMARN
ncbi:SDR family oxidoreductase [Paenibacillus crassostreae]|uniref:Oxidoreductase n=1 Tax=Paenibacillus crassostreae TaxID=1763538 RepID=A0A162L1Q2_9BACL|nr:SDR family NAD(P)-dependent oxidoreductase [Paenibacillus crassostreae]AOZ92927.1 oxidoreductase [Paenibacillus crassostreae]OAB71985.1 oxidoreductase [Paenibacillus crassostreae]